MILKINTFLPVFGGFYNTGLSILDELDLRHSIWDNSGEVKDDYLYPICDKATELLDSRRCFTDASKLAVDFINEMFEDLGLDFKFQFQKLISPKEYNFENDSINVELSYNEDSLKKVIQILESSDNFKRRVKEDYASCSGFIPFHSNDYKDWIKDLKNIQEASKKEHIIGRALEYLLKEEVPNIYEDMIYYVQEEMNKDGGVYNYIDWNSLTEWVNKEFNLNIDDLGDLEGLT
jgi:hypothetical protein